MAGNSSTLGVVTALLEAGADLTARTPSDWTPLHMAALVRSISCARRGQPFLRPRASDGPTPVISYAPGSKLTTQP